MESETTMNKQKTKAISILSSNRDAWKKEIEYIKDDNIRLQIETLNNLTVELGHLIIHSQIAINFYLRQKNLLGKEAEESAERSFVKVAQIAEELGWLK
jgi:hypothetical protein